MTAGDTGRAVSNLRAAVVGFTAADMGLYAAVAKRRLAALVGGDEGAALAAQSEAFLKAQLVADGERMSGMLAPGL